MSYDINFSKEMLDVETNETEFQNVASLNYTSNMKGFFVDFFENFGGLKSLITPKMVGVVYMVH